MTDDPLTIAGKAFRSRLIVGTGVPARDGKVGSRRRNTPRPARGEVSNHERSTGASRHQTPRPARPEVSKDERDDAPR
jgi:hypothetical protein